MKNQRILHLSDYEAFEYLANGKHIVEIQRLLLHNSHIDNALAEFERSLRQNPRLPTVVVVDTLQEEYQRGLIPHVIGKDRQQLVHHKMRRLFEHTAFSYAMFQGREIGGRGDDRVLFTALNNPAWIQLWLELLARYKVPLLGLYSLPLLSQQLLKYLPRAPYTLLVAPTPPINTQTIQGIRQTFFVQQQFQFSRLLPITAIQSGVDYVMAQINQVQSFLSNSRVLPANTTLLVIILAEAELVYEFDDFLDKNKQVNINIETIDIIEFSHYLGLQMPESQIYLHTLTLYELIRAPAKNHYARKTDLRYAFYRQVQRGIYFTALLILLGSLTVSVFHLIDGFQEQQQVQGIVERTKTLESKLQELRTQRDLPLEVEYIRDIVYMGRYLNAKHIPPQKSWLNLSHVLTNCQNLTLERLEWGIADSSVELTELFAQINSRPEENKEIIQTGTLPQKFVEGLRLSGKVEPFKNDYIKAEFTVKRCVETLQRHFPEVKLLSSPLSNVSKEVLQQQLGSSDEKTTEAKFIIEILIEQSVSSPTLPIDH